ncbi:MAG: adenine phosphoribosyltransferase [Clostridiaceae bacterium]|jgi:adenine phosphoribosyltransferase|nr:adenine phosphoribosyltransferase [Clostridiaceae bacterium]
MDLEKYIRIIEDFPKEGISFKDVTTLLKEGDAFKYTVKFIADKLRELNVDIIVGPESRGFIFGAPVAYELGVGFIPVRKPGKLPAETIRYEYQLEYGMDALEIHRDSIKKGARVAVVDDLLATGGTVLSSVRLVEQLGGEVVHIGFLIELESLKGREKLKGYDVSSIIRYKI